MSRLIVLALITLISFPAYAGWVEERWSDLEGNNYQGTVGSGSGSSGSGGNWHGRDDHTSTPKPVYDPRKDVPLVKNKAKKAFRAEDWPSAVSEAYNFLELTGWDDKKIHYIYIRASHLVFMAWLEEGGDGTYDYSRKQLIEKFERFLALYPDHKEARQYLAEIMAMRKEDYNLHPSPVAIEYGDAHYDLGQEHVRRQEWGKALDEFRTAIGWNWKDHEAHAMVGWLLEKNGEYQQAREAYLEAVHWGSEDLVVYEYLIGLHERFYDFEAVVKTGAQSLEIDSKQPLVYRKMAEAYEMLNRPAHAMLSHEAALELAPYNPDYIKEVLDIRLEFHDLVEAEALLNRLRLSAGVSAWIVDNYANRIQELRASRERREARVPEVQAQLDLGMQLSKGGNYDDADRAFQQALEVAPNDLDVLMQSMWNNINRDNLVKTVEDAERVLAIDPENYDAKSKIDFILTWEKDEYNLQQETLWQQSLAEVEVLAAQSQKAATAETLEQVKAEAMLGFDTGAAAEIAVLAETPSDPEVSESQRTPKIKQLESLRSDVRDKKVSVSLRLEQLISDESRDSQRTVEIAQLRQELTNLENKEHFLNFSITEELRLEPTVQKSDGASASNRTGESSDPVKVTEMSIGGQALLQEDQVKSEIALEEVRQIALAELKRKMWSQSRQNVDEAGLLQRLDAWLESEPAAAEAVLKSQALMKRAELEYERRQKNPTLRYESELLTDAVLATERREWPGEQNPEPPLENPVAEERERELAILKIYQELKQQDALLDAYDRYDRILLDVKEAD